MGLGARIKLAFATLAGRRTFNYESDPYSIFIRGMFGQAPNRGTGWTGRETALEIPAVARGRNMICSLATLPLEAVDQQNRVVPHPLFAQIDPNIANVVVLAQTIEDLLFDSVAWWRVTRFSSADGYPYNAVRYDPGVVSLTPPPDYQQGYLPSELPAEGADGLVWMNGEPVPFTEVIRFDSPNPPLMKTIRRAVERAISLDDAAGMYADNPRPADYFSPTDPTADPLQQDEIDDVLDSWIEARRRRSTAYVPAALKYNAVQMPTPADLQLVELQKRVGLEIANALGLDPEDLGISTTSRTYQNATDRRQDRINDVYSPYMSAITQRLTMPDVTKRGQRVRFSLRDYLRADPKTRAEVAEIQIRTGVVKREYVAGVIEQLPPEAIPDEAPGQVQQTQQPPAIDAGEATVGDPVQQIEAARTPRLTFSEDSSRMRLDFELSSVEPAQVDEERRVIVGLAVPWGQAAFSAGRKWRFERGSVKFKSLGRVKLLRDHDNSQVLGVLTKLDDTDAGLVATFKVARGPEGDRALALAADGVLDGLSIGVDFRESDHYPDPNEAGARLVRSAALREISLTGMPAFDDSRLTSVRASDEGNTQMNCPTCGEQLNAGVAHTCNPETVAAFARANGSVTVTPAPAPAAPENAPEAPATPGAVTFTAEQFSAFLEQFKPAAPAPATEPEARPVVDPTTTEVRTATTFVREPLPYRFSYQKPKGMQAGRHIFHTSEYDFSSDVFGLVNGSLRGEAHQAAEKRVNGLIKAAFADVDTADVAGLIPKEQRPDLWQPQMDYSTPLWDLTNAGPTDGRPFELPKYNSSSGLVAAATEGVEPDVGAFTVTTQTVTPTQLWGKVEITRQAIRRGGNPQISGVIWDQMLRSYVEAREAAIATFLNTLTAAADIAIPQTSGTPDNTDDLAGSQAMLSAIADLQFARGGNRFSAFAVHQDLYQMFARVTDTTGRPLFPMLSPMNANGTAQSLYRTMDIGGTTAAPAWALGADGQTNSINSWLFDPAKVRAWASQPERLEWDFGATVQNSTRIPQLSEVTLGIYGDIAVANIDINGVRQVTYDPVGS